MHSRHRSRLILVKREGTWKQANDVITMHIASSTEGGVRPQQRADFQVFDRKGRLGIRCFRLDDDVAREGFCMYFLKPADAGVAARTLEAAKQKALSSRKLPAPFGPLEKLLTLEIPASVQALRVQEPIFCLRLYYYDTHAPRENFGLRARVLTEPLRTRLQAEHKDPANLAQELWCPQSGVANGMPGQDAGLYEADLRGSKELTKYPAEIHDRRCMSEGENMPLLQQLARRVCKKLNATKWESYTPITDDFVAFPADGSGFYGDEYDDDLQAAVPGSRIKLLRKRGYLA